MRVSTAMSILLRHVPHVLLSNLVVFLLCRCSPTVQGLLASVGPPLAFFPPPRLLPAVWHEPTLSSGWWWVQCLGGCGRSSSVNPSSALKSESRVGRHRVTPGSCSESSIGGIPESHGTQDANNQPSLGGSNSIQHTDPQQSIFWRPTAILPGLPTVHFGNIMWF